MIGTYSSFSCHGGYAGKPLAEFTQVDQASCVHPTTEDGRHPSRTSSRGKGTPVADCGAHQTFGNKMYAFFLPSLISVSLVAAQTTDLEVLGPLIEQVEQVRIGFLLLPF
jgi:hypothetical protein